MFSYNDKKVFVINGKGGSGKDTFVENVNKYIPSDNYSSIEYIRHIASLLGWDGSKSDKNRKFLSDLKMLSTEYNDMPFQDMIQYINYFLISMYNTNELLFVHIREPKEIKRLVEFCENINIDIHTVYIHNSKLISRTYNNDADDNTEDYAYDYIVDNSSDLEHLDCEVRDFIKYFEIQHFIEDMDENMDEED